jgi:hypothetical protein
MRDRNLAGDHAGALAAAAAAAPYVHARLALTDLHVRHSVADRSDVELAADIELLRQKLALVRPGLAPPLIKGAASPQQVESAPEAAS